MATINNKLIKLSKAAIDQYEINAVNKVLKNEYLGMGEQVKSSKIYYQITLTVMLHVSRVGHQLFS